MKATERETRILSDTIIADRLQIVSLKARVELLEDALRDARNLAETTPATLGTKPGILQKRIGMGIQKLMKGVAVE